MFPEIDGRRRFTETVLAGVSAGVIGLDARGRIELPNRAAAELLGVDLLAAIGRDIGDVVPEFSELIAAARALARRTPSCSTGSSVSRMPAVSMSVTG